MRKSQRALLRRLRKFAAPLLPVRVYERKKIERDALATCSLKYAGKNPSHFVIALSDMDPYLARIILLHEWAHCLAWQSGTFAPEDHGPEWALAYGRLYQLTMER